MTDTFTRMDESTAEQWAVIGQETTKNQGRVADRILMLLESLRDITDGFSCDQLTHCLQTATLAERAGADSEVIVASLCHDIGKAISVPNHGAIAAEMLRPYVRDEVYRTVLHHQDFQGRHYYQHFGRPTDLRERFRDEAWFALCEQFTDDWDQVAFDPAGPTEPLEHFEPLVRQVFARPRAIV
ncbi:MAG: HD domain-containing protein [Actinomycetota bacterium]